MAPPTLLDMATRTAIQHRAGIFDFAEMPYALAKPILRRLEDPVQLREIEANCPQIAQNDNEIWTAFLNRDITEWRQYAARQDIQVKRVDYNLYHKLRSLQKQDEANAEQRLREQMMALDQQKKSNRTQIASQVLPSPIDVDRSDQRPYTRFGESPRPAAKANKNSVAAIRKKVQNAASARRVALSRSKLSNEQVLRNAKAQIKEAPRDMVADRLPQASRMQYMRTHPAVRPHPQQKSQNSFLQKSQVSVIPPRLPKCRTQAEQRSLRRANNIIDRGSRGYNNPIPSAASTTTRMSTSPEKDLVTSSLPAAPSPPRPVIRKRPQPSVFMQSKKRKV